MNTGINNSITYHTARKNHSIANIISYSFAISIATAIITTIGALSTLTVSQFLYPNISLQALLLSITMIPIIIIRDNFGSIFSGIEDFGSLNILQLSTQLGILVATVVIVGILQYGVMGGILSVIIGNFIGLLASIVLIQRLLGADRLRPIINWSYIREITVYGVKVQGSYIATILNYRADIFLLNWFSNETFVGLYTQAVQVGEQMWILSRAVSTAVLPRIAALEGDDAGRNEITPVLSRYLLWVNLIIAVILYFIAEPAIVFLYGEEFRASATILKFLLPGLVFIAAGRVITGDIAGRGRPEINGLHSGLAAIVNIVLNIILIPIYGFIGTAIATSISYGIIYILTLFVFRKMSNTPTVDMILLYRKDFYRVYRFTRTMLMTLNKRANRE